MTFPNPEAWNRDTADALRDERKRKDSPCSFFYSQGRSLVLAAEYFTDERLQEKSRGGVALKHRHKIHLALFGQLMACFEYMLKDFVAKAVDSTTALDDKLQKASWVSVDAAKVLSFRSMATTPGAILVHSTLGWHNVATVNERYQDLFLMQPIANAEKAVIEHLWLLRHSVAHNAGFVIRYDAIRMGMADLAETVVNIDADFIKETFEVLCPIARRVAENIGGKFLASCLRLNKKDAPDFSRDQNMYIPLKKMSIFVDSRTREVPTPIESDYLQDYQSL